ncbi:uncharacterized protein [Rutidosis leptorrhynchoides]|uniref:uncharacterized protein n=1 Tax=Rutidosis leptorrhynchoides TaxID=125765 RepID=UPI003A9A491A
MHAFCALLWDNASCGGKRTDVIRVEERSIMHGTRGQRKKSQDEKELGQHHTRNLFPGKTMLEIGDSSRNVVERIFRATSTDTTRCSINIKQVFKLNNSKETLERFEKFREDVKNRAYEHYHKHPRNMVDGNEQLLFYGTKLTSCKQFGTSKLCKDSNCSICSILKSDFYTAKKKSGIWLTSNCQDIVNAYANTNANVETMSAKIAIMVCRVITGRVTDNMLDSSNYEGEYDSIGGVKSNQLFVKDPSAILPCFVIILNCKYFC